jgi:hypothetical protein
MPDANYAGDDSPGFWGCLFGFIAIFIAFAVWKGCF